MKKVRLIIEKKALEYKKGSVGYVLGTVDGQIIDQQNPEKVFYGASMPKLPMALAQLRKFKGTDMALTNKELSMLLDYSKAYQLALKGKHKRSASSNEIFRAICRGDFYDKGSKVQSYTRNIKIKKDDGTQGHSRVRATAGIMRTKDEEFLKGIGLEKLLPGICRSRGGPGTRRGKWFRNRQTPLGFSNLCLIYQADELAHDRPLELNL